MFTSFRVATISGIPVTLHWAFVLMATWFVTSGYVAGGFDAAAWNAFVIAALFSSVLAHEFGHVAVARRFGIETTSINLSPLGGIAFLDSNPGSPRERILVALGGPAVSLALAVGFSFSTAFFYGDAWEGSVGFYLTAFNVVLFAFNALPFYPMDGGQVLRAAAEHFGGERAGDRTALLSGQIGGGLIAGAGLYAGSWSLVLIGAFLVAVSTLELGLAARRRLEALAEASRSPEPRWMVPPVNPPAVTDTDEGRPRP